MRCVYCELPEIKARTVAENALAWAFPTNIPITLGHTLVIPKRCVPKYEDMTAEEKAALEELRVKIVAGLRCEPFGAEGFNFAWNEAAIAGQSVPHFHLHIIPRKEGDTGIYGYDPRKFIYRPGSREATPEAELAAVAQQIRNCLL